ncbi:MAG: hypothetical protein IKE43_10740 [Coriobacteriales bacterium]|nr:hypothetical protein [Coriobacteriales bacterium]
MKHDLQELFARNRAYAALYRAVLRACSEYRSLDVLSECIEQQKTSASQIQSAAAIIESLVRNGGLETRVLVNGEVYNGTLRDAQADDSIPQDAVVTQEYKTTQAGVDAVNTYNPESLIDSLIATHPSYELGYYLVLEACEAQDGVSTQELQKILREAGALPQDPVNGVETVHASYFTGALETAGALEWRNGAWHITEAGKRVSR